MQSTEYIWVDGKFLPWDEAKIHILTHSMHYGGAVWEGIRCYKTSTGSAVFRLKDHMERLLYSARAIHIDPPHTADEMVEFCLELLRKNKLEQGYIRPLIHHGYGKMGLKPSGAPLHVSISCWPWGKYLPADAVDVKISEFIRIHPKSSVVDAKISGHYANSIIASQALAGSKYHEALFLDFEGKVAEAPGANIFMVKDGIFVTPKPGSILPGLTRDTVITFLRDQGKTVEERDIQPEELLAADEAFFTGTAAEVTAINSIDDVVLGQGGIGPLTAQAQTDYLAIVRGENPNYAHYLSPL